MSALPPPASTTNDTSFSESLAAIPRSTRVRGHATRRIADGVRFAFYGRMSTADYQDVTSSQQWQHDAASRLTAGHGRIVASFFDAGVPRSVPWPQRPQAAALLAALARPDRPFDAIVIGEYERAFCGNQLQHLLPVLTARGVQVWLPEVGGPVDPANPAHEALLMLLGHQSEREVLRARYRTTTAMRAQARNQGRHLGGRPPYGYRLVDAGPHPNTAHARWGRRLHQLDADPDTADHVRWIFARRLDGWSTAAIARTLNADGIASPSQHDPGRNPHRTGTAWCLRTVAAILSNPRYTGRQVWNRQRIDHHETTPGNKRTRAAGQKPTHCANPREDWEISTEIAHPPLVSEADFLAVQQITALPQPDDGNSNRYQLTGLIICGICSRRADGHWVHGRASYRCRHGHNSASNATPGRPKNLYIREDYALAAAAAQYAHLTGGPADIEPAVLVTRLREHGITLICSPDGIVLDGTDNLPDHPADPDRPIDTDGRRTVPIISDLLGTAFNPHQSHPPKRE
ncbi:recombinase family protein [Catenuloplanes japonicus]|uniref:recombinase family protein n=1 Tax=Catenuloplanes japonicus TaxID=33876 RepID=UPI000A10D32F|nr:recombinase family protein [Catenuloplanes japonicus]